MAARQELLRRHRDGYRAVVDALEGVDLDRRPAGGGWTPREIVHHLGDATLTAAVRLRRLLVEDSPRIAGYDEEAYARVLHYDRPIETSLAVFKAALESSTDLLESLEPREWDRAGTHDEVGVYSVDSWLEIQVAHFYDHARQISEASR